MLRRPRVHALSEGGGTSDDKPILPPMLRASVAGKCEQTHKGEKFKDDVELRPGDAEPVKDAVDEETEPQWVLPEAVLLEFYAAVLGCSSVAQEFA